MKVKPWTAMTKKMLWPLMVTGVRLVLEEKYFVNQTQDKNLKEGLTVDTTGAQGVKYKKPKPTNPKPFRLRTDRNEKCLEQRKCNHDTNESSGNQLQKNYQKDEPGCFNKKAMACGKQLTVVKEISSTTSRSEEAGEPSHNDISHANKAAASSASRSLSRGKRPLTIPKEPNFHDIHVPKCYARKVA
ncbi:hypothetical protein ACSBR2_019016 [Camellia fascicularis]